MTLVIDASIALSWCFEDEASEAADAIASSVLENGGVVPSLFPLEVANSLLSAERRGRIAHADCIYRLELISQLPFEIDQQSASRASREIFAIARAEQLTIYDAAYLELAVRKGARLATKDKALKRAGERMGVTVWFV